MFRAENRFWGGLPQLEDSTVVGEARTSNVMMMRHHSQSPSSHRGAACIPMIQRRSWRSAWSVQGCCPWFMFMASTQQARPSLEGSAVLFDFNTFLWHMRITASCNWHQFAWISHPCLLKNSDHRLKFQRWARLKVCRPWRACFRSHCKKLLGLDRSFPNLCSMKKKWPDSLTSKFTSCIQAIPKMQKCLSLGCKIFLIF